MDNEWIIEPLKPQEKSIPRRAGEFALGLTTQGFRGALEQTEEPSNFFQMSEQHAAQHLAPLTKRLSEGSKKLLKQEPVKQWSEHVEPFVKSQFGETSIEPESNFTRGLQAAARVAPAIAAGKFSVGSFANPRTWINALKGIPGAFIGAVPGAVAYESFGKDTGNEGFGRKALKTTASIAANVLGKHGFKYLAQGFNKLTNSNYFSEPGKSVIEAAKSGFYKERDELSKDIKDHATGSIRTSLDDIVNQSRGGEGIALSTVDKGEIADKVKTLQEMLPGLTENPSKYIQIKEAINKLFERWQEPALRPWFAKIRSAIETELDKIGESNHEWNIARKTADELHSIQKWQPNLVQFLIKWTGTGKIYDLVSDPVAQGALAVMTGIGKGSSFYTGAAAIPIAGKLAVEGQRGWKFFTYLNRTKEGQKLLMNIGLNAAKGSEAALAKDIHAMNRLVPKFEKEEQKENKKQNNSNEWIVH